MLCLFGLGAASITDQHHIDWLHHVVEFRLIWAAHCLSTRKMNMNLPYTNDYGIGALNMCFKSEMHMQICSLHVLSKNSHSAERTLQANAMF